MSVYVDDPIVYLSEPRGYVGRKRARARWGHMIADTLTELHTMARRIGLRPTWFQPGHGGHYDLVPSKRLLALKRGAIVLSRREFVEKMRSLAMPKRRRLRRCACGLGRYFVRPDVQRWLWSLPPDEGHYWRHVYLGLAIRFWIKRDA